MKDGVVCPAGCHRKACLVRAKSETFLNEVTSLEL